MGCSATQAYVGGNISLSFTIFVTFPLLVRFPILVIIFCFFILDVSDVCHQSVGPSSALHGSGFDASCMASQVRMAEKYFDNIDLETLHRVLFTNEDDIKPASQTGLQSSEDINILCLNLHCSVNGQDTSHFDFHGFYANEIDMSREKSALFKSFLDTWFADFNCSPC